MKPTVTTLCALASFVCATAGHAQEPAKDPTKEDIVCAFAADAPADSYNAAANLYLRHLPEAEKSALRAIEIDKSHKDPRPLSARANL